MRKAKDIARYFQHLPPANVRRGTVNFMYYVSTRGNGGKVTSAQAIKQGIAADGGLFVPESLPQAAREARSDAQRIIDAARFIKFFIFSFLSQTERFYLQYTLLYQYS